MKFDPSSENLSAENVTTIVANVTAKEAVNVSQENDKKGEKPLTSHYSKGNSGK